MTRRITEQVIVHQFRLYRNRTVTSFPKNCKCSGAQLVGRTSLYFLPLFLRLQHQYGATGTADNAVRCGAEQHFCKHAATV